jgi:hypothetical protein
MNILKEMNISSKECIAKRDSQGTIGSVSTGSWIVLTFRKNGNPVFVNNAGGSIELEITLFSSEE